MSGPPQAVANSGSEEQELLRAAEAAEALVALHLERETLDQRIVWLLEQQGLPSCLWTEAEGEAAELLALEKGSAERVQPLGAEAEAQEELMELTTAAVEEVPMV